MSTSKPTAYYTVEAWRGLSAVGYFHGCQARTVARRAEAFRLDNGADRIIVRQIGGGIVAKWSEGRGWQTLGPALEGRLGA